MRKSTASFTLWLMRPDETSSRGSWPGGSIDLSARGALRDMSFAAVQKHVAVLEGRDS